MFQKSLKASNPAQLNELNCSSSSELDSIQVQKKIPKKAMFVTVKYTSFKQARMMRVKFWKVRKFQMAPVQSEMYREDQSSSFGLSNIKLLGFPILLACPTLKRSHKLVKKVNLASTVCCMFHLGRIFSRLWKLEMFEIILHNSKIKMKHFFQRFMNPKVKKVYLKFDFPLYQDILSQCKYMKGLELYLKKVKGLSKQLKLFYNDANLRIKLIAVAAQKNRIGYRLEKASVIHPLVFPLAANIEEMDFSFDYSCGRLLDYTFKNFPAMPNLKHLNFKLENYSTNKQTIDLSLIGNCTKLESVKFDLEGVDIISFDFLEKISKLTHLSLILKSHQQMLQRIKLPILTTLESFKLHLDHVEYFDVENIKNVIQGNIKLQHLDLKAQLKNLVDILQDNERTLNLKSLKVFIEKIPPEFHQLLTDFNGILKRHEKVRKMNLKLNLIDSSPQAFDYILQTLEGYKNLDALNLAFRHAGELQDRIFANLRSLLESLYNLKSIKLDTHKDQINSRDLLELMGGIEVLKRNLQKLKLKASFKDVSGRALEKFIELISSFRNLKRLNVEIKGELPEEEHLRLRKIIGDENFFWKNDSIMNYEL